MAYTNETSNLGLPQWLGTDKPNWDIDLNEAFRKIDDNAGNVADDISELEGKHDTTVETLTHMQSEITAVQDINNVQNERLTDLESDNVTNKAAINKLNNDVSGLENRVDTLEETTIPAVQETVEQQAAQVGLNTQNIVNLQDVTKWLNKINKTPLCLMSNSSGSYSMSYNFTTNGTVDMNFSSPTLNVGGSGSESLTVRGGIPYVRHIFVNDTDYRVILFNSENFVNFLFGIMHAGSSVPSGSTFTLHGALCAGTSTLTMTAGSTTFTYNSKKEIVYDGITQGVSINMTRTSNTGSFGAAGLNLTFLYDVPVTFGIQSIQ